MQQRDLHVGEAYVHVGYSPDPEYTYTSRMRAGRHEDLQRVTVTAKDVHLAHPKTARSTRGVQVLFDDGRCEDVLALTLVRAWDEHLSERACWQAAANRNERRRVQCEQQIRAQIAARTAQLTMIGVDTQPEVPVLRTDDAGEETFGAAVKLHGVPLAALPAAKRRWSPGSLWVSDRLLGTAERVLGDHLTSTVTVDLDSIDVWVQHAETGAVTVDADRDAALRWYERQPAIDATALASAAETLSATGMSATISAATTPVQWLVLAESGAEIDEEKMVSLRALQLILLSGPPTQFDPTDRLRRSTWKLAGALLPPESTLTLASFRWDIGSVHHTHLAQFPEVAVAAERVERRVRALLTAPARTA